MELKEYRKLFEIEESHWWYQNRRKIVHRAMEFIGYEGKRVLDIACGCGMNYLEFGSRCSITGIDISDESLKFCKMRGYESVIKCDATQLPFDDKKFDIVLAIDALEHFNNDCKAVKEIARVLKSRGFLVVNVPAYNFMWSPHDIAFGHRRRYSKRQFNFLLYNNGFELCDSRYWGLILFLPLLIWRTGRRFLGENLKDVKSDFHFKLFSLVGSLLKIILGIEVMIFHFGLNSPIGTSLFAVARKKGL